MKRTQKLLHIGLGNENQTFLNIQADSARTGSSLKKKGLKFSKLCDPYLIDQPKDQPTKDLYWGFTDNDINITRKLCIAIVSNRWLSS